MQSANLVKITLSWLILLNKIQKQKRPLSSVASCILRKKLTSKRKALRKAFSINGDYLRVTMTKVYDQGCILRGGDSAAQKSRKAELEKLRPPALPASRRP
jgi:hypothetical protein